MRDNISLALRVVPADEEYSYCTQTSTATLTDLTASLLEETERWTFS